jgi:hypothetical protein
MYCARRAGRGLLRRQRERERGVRGRSHASGPRRRPFTAFEAQHQLEQPNQPNQYLGELQHVTSLQRGAPLQRILDDLPEWTQYSPPAPRPRGLHDRDGTGIPPAAARAAALGCIASRQQPCTRRLLCHVAGRDIVDSEVDASQRVFGGWH